MIGLQRLAIPSCSPAKCQPAKRPPFSLDLPAVIVVFIGLLPNWGLFGIIKQICHANVCILMECLPSGGWFSSVGETFHQDTHTGMAYLYNGLPTHLVQELNVATVFSTPIRNGFWEWIIINGYCRLVVVEKEVP